MSADVNTQPCQCELCQPNWYLGRDDDHFEPQPVEQIARQTALEQDHARKVARQDLELAGATG